MESQEVVVRRAKARDLPSLLCMYKALHEGSPYADIPYREDSAAAWITQHLDAPAGIVQIAEKDGEAVGFVMGAIREYPPNPDYRCAAESGLYVVPDKRSSRSGVALVRKFEQIAKQRGAQMVAISKLKSEDSGIKNSTANGYSLVEAHYLKKVS